MATLAHGGESNTTTWGQIRGDYDVYFSHNSAQKFRDAINAYQAPAPGVLMSELVYTGKPLTLPDGTIYKMPPMKFYGYTPDEQILIDKMIGAIESKVLTDPTFRALTSVHFFNQADTESVVSLRSPVDLSQGNSKTRGVANRTNDGNRVLETIIDPTNGSNNVVNTADDKAHLLVRIWHEISHETSGHYRNALGTKTLVENMNAPALTAADVRAIDTAYGAPRDMLPRIAAEVGVSQSTLERVADIYINEQVPAYNMARDYYIREQVKNRLPRLVNDPMHLNRSELDTAVQKGILRVKPVTAGNPPRDLNDPASYEMTPQALTDMATWKATLHLIELKPDGGLFDSLGEAVDGALAFAREFFASYSSVIGQSLGSTLGRYITDNEFGQAVSSTALGVIGLNIGQQIENNLRAAANPAKPPVANAFDDIQQDLLNATAGTVSSFLTAELFESLGLEGTLAGLGQSLFAMGLTEIILNLDDIAAGVSSIPDVLSGIEGAQVANLIAGYIGTRIASELIEFDTVGGQIGAAVGSSIGVVVGAAAGADGVIIGMEVGATYGGPIGAVIGAIIGYVFGGLVGSLFGGNPRSGAEAYWDEGNQKFAMGRAWAMSGGAKEAALSIGTAVTDVLNAVIQATGSRVLDGASVRAGEYGTFKKDYVYRPVTGAGVGVGEITFRTRDVNELIQHGSAIGVYSLVSQLAGGDIYVKRAIAATMAQTGGDPTSNGPSAAGGFAIETLLGNIAVAADYSRYVSNPTEIDLMLAAEPESAFAAGWTITFARAVELGLTRRSSVDWTGGWNAFLDEKLDKTIDGVAFNAANVGFTLDEGTNQRRTVFTGPMGELIGTVGDTIDTAGKDNITGGGGADTITVSLDRILNTSGLTINGTAATGAQHIIDIAAKISGGGGNDTITGGELGNDLFGGEGNDTLVGGSLDDWLFGEEGNDRLFAGAANTAFADGNAIGTANALFVQGGNGNLLDGGAGDDSLYGSRGSDFLRGGAGVDLLLGGAGGDILDGGAGNDGGPAGEARLLGGAGSDQYVFGYGSGVDIAFDESDGASGPGGPGDTLYARMVAINNGTVARNWAGGGDYEVDGSIRGGEDAVSFGPGIGLADLVLTRSTSGGGAGQDLIIELTVLNPTTNARTLTGDRLTLKDWFEPTRRVEWLRFADGTEIRIGHLSSVIVGSAGNDVIIGTLGGDFAVAGDGDDRMHLLAGDDFGFGGRGSDLVAGDDDNDMVAGGADDDDVIGGAGNDTVFGDSGADDVYGGTGSDIVAGGSGDDQVVGGSGDDIFIFARGDGRDTVFDDFVNNWEVVWQAGNYVNGYTLNPSTGQVTKGADVVFDGARWIGRYDYTDTGSILRRHLGALTAGGPVTTNAGNDVLEFAAGIDIQDLMLRRVGNNLEVAVTLGDTDERSFDAVSDRITFNEWYTLGAPIESFVFLATGRHQLGTWTLAGSGTEGADTLDGGTGIDWITGNGGDDTISGNDGADILAGNTGADTIRGGAGADVLYGGSGNDLLDGGAAADVLIGGTGIDIASYASATGGNVGMRASLAAPDTNSKEGIGDTYNGIEGLEGTTGNDTLAGNEAGNVLRGNTGNDNLYGGAGDDIYEINPSHGQDTIRDAPFITQSGAEVFQAGNGGNDAIDFGAGIGLPELVFARLNSNADLRITYAASQFVTILGQNDPNRAIESLQFRDGLVVDLSTLRILGEAATSGADFMVGDTTDNTLSGLDGDDILSGGTGVDTLLGGNGDDILEGGATNDVLDGGSDSITEGLAPSATDQTRLYGDTSRYVRSGAAIRVDLVSGESVGGMAGGDQIVFVNGVSTIENLVGSDGFGDTLRGDSRANRLFGLGFNDNIDGRGGDDVLVGGTGNDTLTGGDGDDNLAGEEGDDTMNAGTGKDLLAGGTGVDTMNGNTGDDVLSGGAGNDIMHGNEDNDTLGGDEGADQLFGDAGQDNLSGGGGNDTLSGGDGDDILAGGTGDDSLQGGMNNDTYMVFADSGTDTIVDAAGQNRLLISEAEQDRVWLARSGNDLRVTVIGGATVIVQNYYASTSPTLLREISIGTFSLYLTHSQALVQAMTAISVTPPASMPPEIANLLTTYWHAPGTSTPFVSDQTVTTNEDTSISGTVGAADHDDNIVSYAVETAPTDGVVAINVDTGAWTFTPVANRHGPQFFVIRVTDADGNQARQTVNVNVTSVNDAPTDVTLTGAPAGIAERDHPITGTTLDAVVLGTLAAVDADSPSEAFGQHQFTVSDSRFEVVGNQLRLKAGVALDYETATTVSFNVTARDTNGTGLSFTRQFTFNVLDQDDYFYGTSGTDTITGTAGRNLIYGQGGNDILNGAGANDLLDGGDGADQLFGNGGADTLEGFLGDDTLEGGAGNDTLRGGDGIDTLRGGDGTDTLFGDGGNDLLQGGLLNDELDGGADNDRLEGDAGNDRLVGGNGNDILIGGAGGDRFLGGAGTDTVSYETATAGVTLNLAAGTGTVGDANGDIFEDTPEILIGSAFADTLTGSAGDDTIEGGAGNDTIVGGAGHDILRGGDGDDTLDALAGNDSLDGGTGNDILIGGDNNDTYLMNINSGADEIRNFDQTNSIDVIGYQNVDRRQLWFRKVNNDLVVTIVGTTTVTTIKDWYTNTDANGRSNYQIDFFIATGHVTETIDAEALVNLMAAHPMPTTQEEFETLLATPAFGNPWNAAWDPNAPPVIVPVTTQTINEDGTLTITVRVTDDVTPVNGVTVTAQAVNPANFNQEDLTRVNAPTVGIPNGSGDRTLTVTTKPNQSGQVAIKVRAVDAGGLITEHIFLLNITPVADAPTVTQAQAAAPVAPLTKPTLDSGSWAINLQAALTDQDGSETLEVRIANVPAGLTFNAGTNLGGGVWSFTPAQLPGLLIQGAATWSQDLALSVTAVSRETNNTTATSAAVPLNIVINARPTDIAADRTLLFNENQGAVGLAWYLSTDADSGETFTYALTNNANGMFTLTSAGLLSSTASFNYEAVSSYTIQVRVTDSGGLTRTEDFVINVGNVNEAPTDLWEDRALSFSENFSLNTGIAWFVSSDPEGGTMTYTLADTYGGRFSVRSDGLLSTGSTPLDYEAATTHPSNGTRGYFLRVRVTDSGGLWREEDFWFQINNVNEAPTGITTALSVPEIYGPAGTYIGTISGSDPDGTLRFQMLGGGAGDSGNPLKFTLDPSGNGNVYVHGALEADGPSARTTYDISVRAWDGGAIGAGNWHDTTVRVNVTGVNEGPKITAYTGETWYSYWDDNTGSWQSFQSYGFQAVDPEGHGVAAVDFYNLFDFNPAAATQPTDFWYWEMGDLSGTAAIEQFWVGYKIPFFYHMADVRLWDSTGVWADTRIDIFRHQATIQIVGPIVLDLDGKGFAFTSVANTTVRFDIEGDGTLEYTGWIAGDDGLLVLDRNGDGQITNGTEISFTQDLPGAQTDLEGLAAFDSDGDGYFDSGDASYASFHVWRDANMNAVSEAGELFSLAALQIDAIDLKRTPTGLTPVNDAANTFTASSSFVRSDGTTGWVADAGLSYSSDPVRVDLREIEAESSTAPEAPPPPVTSTPVNQAPEDESMDEIDRTSDGAHSARPRQRELPMQPSGQLELSMEPSAQLEPRAPAPAPVSESESGVPSAPETPSAPAADRRRPGWHAREADATDDELNFARPNARGALHASLDSVARRRLQMIDAMASFSVESSAELHLLPHRRIDARTLEWLTSLPNSRNVA